VTLGKSFKGKYVIISFNWPGSLTVYGFIAIATFYKQGWERGMSLANAFSCFEEFEGYFILSHNVWKTQTIQQRKLTI